MSEQKKREERTFIEELELDSAKLVGEVKRLIQAGNVRRLIIRGPDGNLLLEIPLTAGVAVGGVLTLFAPILAAVGALAALVARVKLQVVRVEEEKTSQPPRHAPGQR
ncbi:DUF4342 domain-containing protein [candidate division WOR-3 bacterium]|nr:DUF4342 domain-containing protein [candidate division WOR-3 bacterium]